MIYQVKFTFLNLLAKVYYVNSLKMVAHLPEVHLIDNFLEFFFSRNDGCHFTVRWVSKKLEFTLDGIPFILLIN